MKAYEYLNPKEINKLRQDLMTDNNDLETRISTEVNDIINDERGNNLEENIRKTLEHELGWKTSNIPRDFYYRQVTINDKNYIISKYKYISFTANEQIFFIKFNDNNCSSEIYKNDLKRVNQKIKDNPNAKYIQIGHCKLIFWPKNKIEIDGIYKINGFDFSLFPNDEFNIIYRNINDNEKEAFKYAAIEVKLNKRKMKELAVQLKNDYEVLGKIINQKMVFIGIVNSSSLSFKYEEYVKQFNCVIFGIKNSIVYKRNMIAPIDWNLVAEFRQFKTETVNKINNINDQINNMNDKINHINDALSQMKNDIDFIKNYIKLNPNNNSQDFLNKKRRRKKKKKKSGHKY